MKKYGKYEMRPEGVPVKQSKVKSALLQTYLTSLLCMVLCVTMFFGTSYAWFTSEVTNEGNEIYIGTLDVDLLLGDISLKDNPNTKVFNNTIWWEPGYTALRTLSVVNKGNLAFNYELAFTDGEITGKTADEMLAVAEWFDIWVYHNANNETPTPENYEQITEENGWTPVGTLAEALSGKAVFEGKMDEADVVNGETTHTYTVALHMTGETVEAEQEDALNALMGQSLALNVKLVASQRSSEVDGFGNNRYDATFVATGEELKAALEDPNGGTVVLIDDINWVGRTEVVGDVLLDMNGHTITDETDALAIMVNANAKLTITGNGVFNKTNHYKNLIYCYGELNVMDGTFAYAKYNWGECTDFDSHGAGKWMQIGNIFVCADKVEGNTVYDAVLNIYGGTFDSGILNTAVFATNTNTDSEKSLVYPLVNNSAEATSNGVVTRLPGEVRIYGGTYVSGNPAYGDANAPHSSYLVGQTEDQKGNGILPDGYTVVQGTTEDGRTTYTYSYTDPAGTTENG